MASSKSPSGADKSSAVSQRTIDESSPCHITFTRTKGPLGLCSEHYSENSASVPSTTEAIAAIALASLTSSTASAAAEASGQTLPTLTSGPSTSGPASFVPPRKRHMLLASANETGDSETSATGTAATTANFVASASSSPSALQPQPAESSTRARAHSFGGALGAGAGPLPPTPSSSAATSVPTPSPCGEPDQKRARLSLTDDASTAPLRNLVCLPLFSAAF